MNTIYTAMFALCLFFSAGHTFGQATTGDDRETLSKSWFEKGLQHYQRGEYDPAIDDFSKAIELDRDCTQAYVDRGHALEQRGLKARAKADYDKAADIKRSAISNEWFNRGMQYFKKREYDQAIAAYSRAIEMKPDLFQAYANRGVAYSKREMYGRAIADYDKALELDSTSAYVYSSRGLAYFNFNQFEKAIKDHTTALSLKPNDGVAYHSRGVAYAALKLYDRAIYDFSRSLAIDPNNADAYSSRGAVYYKSGNVKNALGDYEKACSLGIAGACKNAKNLGAVKNKN